MKLQKIIPALWLFLIFPVFVTGQQSWVADHDHTQIKFSAVFMGVSEVDGYFKDYRIEVKATENDFSNAEAKVIIQAESIETNNDMRDDHLRSEDFLFVNEYPKIIFESTSITGTDDNSYTLKGKLTIRGVTHDQNFKLKYNGRVERQGKPHAAFKLTGTLNRFNYNVDFNESFIGGAVVSEEIEIECDVMLVKK